MSAVRIFLRPGREKSLLRRHPWIFSGAVGRIVGEAVPGTEVEVCDASGKFLARGDFGGSDQLVVKLWTSDETEMVDAEFFRRKFASALALRRALHPFASDGAERLIDAEGDGLPGIVADRYGDTAVLQLLSCGAESRRDLLADLILEMFPVKTVWERSDGASRRKENLEDSCGLLRGPEPPAEIEIVENGVRFGVDIRTGHKTGFYLDQSENRRIVAGLAPGRDMLNVFCYSGGFGVTAAAAGAKRVVNVDSSAPALELAKANFDRNGIAADAYELVAADGFSQLRKYRAEHRTFDLIVLDPPKLAESQKALPRACRAYKDMAWVAFQLLNPGGMLVNFSCSGLMPPDLFQKITADAALDAGVSARIVRRLWQAPDHPVALTTPETAYLKGLLTVV